MHGRKMPATLRFMLASRRSELLGLEDLARTCELVTRISQLVHALQKERGYSNIYLSGNAAHQRQQLDVLSLEAEALEREVRLDLDRIDLDAVSTADKTRLFTRIAYALHSLDELPALRRRIREHAISMQDATATLVRLIGGLLAVVFEAADTAADPDITRCLVALFNFMQGKELAGQERALGVVGFASGYFRADMLERLEHLLEGQERCFATFSRFASPAAQALWQALCASETNINACRLRDIARRTSPGAAVEPQLCELWFELQDFKQVQASVFEVARAPGKNIVYLGCALLILGIFAMLYIRERRIWVWLAPRDGATHATMALSTNRKTMDGDREFAQLTEKLIGVAPSPRHGDPA